MITTMTITNETIEATINQMLLMKQSAEEIEECFKTALKEKLINVDAFYTAMEILYK